MKSNILPWAIVGVLGVLLLWSLNTESGEPIVITERHTDTLTIVKHDTTVVTKVKIEKAPADTVFLTVRDSIYVPIPRQEYTFSEPNMFDFRVKGYMVEFMDAKVYPKTVYETITNTVETTIYKDSWNLYFGAGIWAFNKDIVPTLNLTLKTPKRWLISLNTGYYNGGFIYGGQFSYKILGK